MMTDDFKNGLITGFAMQPLSVTTENAPHGGGDNMCGAAYICAYVVSDDGMSADVTPI